MPVILSKRNIALAVVFMVVVPLASKLSHAVQKAMLDSEVRKMTEETKTLKMKTICAGRFLIDVPGDADISYRSAFVSGWDIKSDGDETSEAFTARIKAKEAELKAGKNARGQSSLELVKDVETQDVKGKIFVFGRKWTYGIEDGKRVDSTFAAMHAYVRADGVSFDLKAPITGDEDLQDLVKLVSQLRARKQDEIPQHAGFCFDRGVVLDPLNVEQNERVTVFAGLPSHPDVSIAFSTMAGLEPGPSLLQKDAKSSVKQEHPGNFRTIKKGAREINGIPGEELLDLVFELNGNKAQDFTWESSGKKEDVFSPHLVFELNSGHGQPGAPVPSSISDAAALALWQKMSSSLRLRPTKSEQQRAPIREPAPLGTVASAGSACPQSGWWRCTDGSSGEEITGSTLRYFHAGETVPQALPNPRATGWRRLVGYQDNVHSEMSSEWKLVERRKKRRNAPNALLMSATEPNLDGTSEKATRALTDVIAQHMAETVGARLLSGADCTASGWWKCLDEDAIDGTRWFPIGAVLPVATKLIPLTVIDKIKGVPGYIRQPVVWQFIRPATSEAMSIRANSDSFPPEPDRVDLDVKKS